MEADTAAASLEEGDENAGARRGSEEEGAGEEPEPEGEEAGGGNADDEPSPGPFRCAEAAASRGGQGKRRRPLQKKQRKKEEKTIVINGTIQADQGHRVRLFVNVFFLLVCFLGKEKQKRGTEKGR